MVAQVRKPPGTPARGLRDLVLAACIAGVTALAGGAAAAETRLTLMSAAPSSPYHAMTEQLAGMLREESGGALLATVQASRGSVQNLMEAGRREEPFLFTAPPNLIADARAGRAPFDAGGDYERIRALFPMPFVTIHFVVRAGSGIESVEDLRDRTFITGGTGSFCAAQAQAVLGVLGLAGEVETLEVALARAPAALKDGRVDGFAACFPHPMRQVEALAATLDIRILSFTEEQRARIMREDPGAGATTIAAGTYAGQDEDVETVAAAVGAYGANIDAALAAFIVERFWAQREALAEENPFWAGVEPELVVQLRAPLHRGVIDAYEARGVEIPTTMRLAPE